MRKPPSMVGQIIRRSVAVSVTMILALFALLAWRLEYASAELEGYDLSVQAADIARAMTVANGAPRLALPPGLAKAYADPASGTRFAVLDESGRLLFASSGTDAPLTPAPPPDRRKPQFFTHRPGAPGNWTAGGAFRAERDGRIFWIEVSQGMDHPDVLVESLVLEFLDEAGWLLLPFLGLLVIVNVLTLRRCLAPLTEASRAAAAIGPAAMGVRLSEHGLPAELRPLAGAINDALDRLEDAFRLQQDFIADAAHELRTPLAILEAHLESLPDRRLVGVLQDDVRRLSRLIGQLLRAAQLEVMMIGPSEHADIRAVALEVARAIAPLAIRQGKTIEVTGGEHPIPVRGSAEALTDAIRNLVENGLSHTPPGTAVEIALAENPPRITVRDAGKGFPEAQRRQATQRFWRGTRNREGAGLGLAIVARIVRAHGAKFSIATAPQGGAEVLLEFPPLPEAA